MHHPGNQPELGHFLNVDVTSSVFQRNNFLFYVQWSRLDDLRQIVIAADDDIGDDLAVKDTLFVRRGDNFRVWGEMTPSWDNRLHPCRSQSPHLLSGMAESLRIPDSIEEHECMRLEIPFSCLPLAVPVGDMADLVVLPGIEQGHEHLRVNLRPVGRDHHQGIHLRRVKEIGIVVGQQEIDRIPYLRPHRMREDVLGNTRPKHSRQHARVIEYLRTAESPFVMGEVVAVPRRIEINGGIEIPLQHLDVARDCLGGAGKVEVLLDVGLPHICGETGTIGVAVLLELRHKANQSHQLFLVYRHSCS